MYKTDKCMEVINLIFNDTQLGEFYFNINDLSILVDIVLREITANNDAGTRVNILKLMFTILKHKTYCEEFYKLEEMENVINELV